MHKAQQKQKRFLLNAQILIYINPEKVLTIIIVNQRLVRFFRVLRDKIPLL